MVINKKVLANFIEVREAKARLDELQALRPFLNTNKYWERKTLLENKIKEITGRSKKITDKTVINIIINE
jgi:hypothetical protein